MKRKPTIIKNIDLILETQIEMLQYAIKTCKSCQSDIYSIDAYALHLLEQKLKQLKGSEK